MKTSKENNMDSLESLLVLRQQMQKVQSKIIYSTKYNDLDYEYRFAKSAFLNVVVLFLAILFSNVVQRSKVLFS